MKRIKTILLALSAAMFTQVSAQNDETNISVRNERSGQEEIIQLPEGMTASCDSLLGEWLAKKYLFPDTTCVDPDVNPTFPAEVYAERLRRLPVVMEMPYNAVVQQFIERYTSRLRRSVSYMLGAANMYIPIFEEALDYYGLPLELKYLPVIESALEPKARSHAGAVGLWQFMLPTAKRYGLTVNSLIDERQDPYKATRAAARYLRDLYKIFGDWNLVIAAYNCGPSNVNKAIHRADGSRDYWTIYPYLPAETRGYVPAFIAANYVMNYYCEHNICPMKTHHPIVTDSVTIDRDLHMEQVAELCHIDKDAIHALNPQYRSDLIPGKSGPMTLTLPAETLTTFIDYKDSIYNYRADELLTRRETVEVNIKSEPRPTVKQRASHVKAGKNERNARNPRNTHKGKKERNKSVTIKQGDSLSEIARRNGTTVNKLRKLNGIKGNNIRAGKKIRVK